MLLLNVVTANLMPPTALRQLFTGLLYLRLMSPSMTTTEEYAAGRFPGLRAVGLNPFHCVWAIVCPPHVDGYELPFVMEPRSKPP